MKKSNSHIRSVPDLEKSILKLLLFCTILVLNGISARHASAQQYLDSLIVKNGQQLQLEWDSPVESDSVVYYWFTWANMETFDVYNAKIENWEPISVGRVGSAYIPQTIKIANFGRYEVYLRAVNQYGSSGPSDKYLVDFIQGEPGAPRLFRIVVIQND